MVGPTLESDSRSTLAVLCTTSTSSQEATGLNREELKKEKKLFWFTESMQFLYESCTDNTLFDEFFPRTHFKFTFVTMFVVRYGLFKTKYHT